MYHTFIKKVNATLMSIDAKEAEFMDFPFCHKYLSTDPVLWRPRSLTLLLERLFIVVCVTSVVDLSGLDLLAQTVPFYPLSVHLQN